MDKCNIVPKLFNPRFYALLREHKHLTILVLWLEDERLSWQIVDAPCQWSVHNCGRGEVARRHLVIFPWPQQSQSHLDMLPARTQHLGLTTHNQQTARKHNILLLPCHNE